jgi:hypothetical protein
MQREFLSVLHANNRRKERRASPRRASRSESRIRRASRRKSRDSHITYSNSRPLLKPSQVERTAFTRHLSFTGSILSTNVNAVFYPSGGLEGHIGPVVLRLDVGDEMYFNSGTTSCVSRLALTFASDASGVLTIRPRARRKRRPGTPI